VVVKEGVHTTRPISGEKKTKRSKEGEREPIKKGKVHISQSAKEKKVLNSRIENKLGHH